MIDSDLLAKAQAIKDELKLNKIVQEFLYYKKLIEEDKNLIELKKNIVRCQNEGRNDEHDNLVTQYNNYPIVVNYNNSKEELLNLLNQIKEVLEDK